MNTFHRSFRISTPQREVLIDITRQVAEQVADSGVRNGLCVVSCPHTTAAITINENADPDVKRDVIAMLHDLVPNLPTFRHAEGNSDAHVKSSLVGASETIAIADGSLQLGTWQGILFAEFDGSRNRRVNVTILGT